MKELVEKYKVLIFDKDTQELLCVKYFDNSPNEVELIGLLIYYQNIDNKKAKDLEIRIDHIYILK
jgi:hypothetical protein